MPTLAVFQLWATQGRRLLILCAATPLVHTDNAAGDFECAGCDGFNASSALSP